MQRSIGKANTNNSLGIRATKTVASLVWVIMFIFLSSSLAQEGNFQNTQSFESILTNTFFIEEFTTPSNLSVGHIHFQSFENNVLIDGEAKVGLANLTTDTWGYAEHGFEISLTSKSNPYAIEISSNNSSDIRLSTSFFNSLDSLVGVNLSDNLGLSGFTEFSLVAGFDNSPIPVSALGTIGYRQSFDTNLPLLTSFVTLDRISVEPKVKAWYDSDFNFGADLDVAIRADTSISDVSNLSLGLEGGYTNGFWYNFTINSPVKF